ncbi:alanine/glycine:cation symporter family protein [Paenalcaligenes suwonensis]|uniref:alanine/glycine:cation symporter family protein n=1 Tax=Paenalcaligenes suwonensis TaxID=1202713 RepID=UPI00140E11B1|nr:sodium:alanine symporter family protein [Paenalcaligenes suwonensis]NHC62590.1 sodium:alanine symporter family protein [Paenalcaligenes suwonensis]
MEKLQAIFETVGGWVWGPAMLILLVGTGVLLTVRLKGLQFTKLPMALRQAFTHTPGQEKEKGDVSHFGALMTALSATIGTGNIAGVATAVVLGGPGAVFWMWITAIFGMATKYAEGILAVHYRITDARGEMAGGPMYYIERGLNMKWLAVLFAFFAVIASFGIGSSVQSNSVAESIYTSFGIEHALTGVVLTILTAIVILGGIKSIARAASIIVPVMAVVYVLGGLIIIGFNLEKLLPALSLIFTDAFTGSAVAGGALGTVIRYGVARGVFSNEAGMGSAPIAAAAAKTDHAGRQALVSMTGTFLDTIVVCSITGIVLVMAGQYADGSTGAALTTHSFNAMLPGWGGYIVTFGLVFFAYSTILGWCYYGEKCAAYLLGTRAVLPYRVIYVASVMMGTIASLDLVWAASDTFNGLMAIPNLIALLLLSGVVVKETKDFFNKIESGQLPK